MSFLPAFSSRLLFPLLLLLTLTVELAVPPRAIAHAIKPRRNATTTAGPVFGEWLEGVNLGRPSDRRTVVRVAAIGMALALFIMFRSKH
jgi:hypothetical protein